MTSLILRTTTRLLIPLLLLFSLFLGRPVIVLGDPTASPVHVSHLRRLAKGVIDRPRSDRRTVDRGIRAAYRWAKRADCSVGVASLPQDDAAADAVVDALLRMTTIHLPRPDLDRLAKSRHWDRYLSAFVPPAN